MRGDRPLGNPLLVGAGLVLTSCAALQYERGVRRALALANARLETKFVELEQRTRSLEQRTRSITLLGKMSDRLQTAVHPADAYASIADSARQLFPLEAGAVCVIDPARNIVEVVASWREPATRSEFAPGDCRILRRARVQAVSDDDTAPICAHVTSDSTARYTCLPVTCDGETLGIVCLACPLTNERETSAADDPLPLELGAAFTEQVGLALTNVHLKERLRRQASHDQLTGLHNRRFLEDGFYRDVLRAARNRSPVGVLMLDLDHFKVFNDAHGHAAGDALLCAFATGLRNQIRATDIACRYGGEEFAVILPDATLNQSLTRAEKIREATRQMTVEFEGTALPEITVSIGVAALPQHGVSPDALLRAADAALYTAKANGRNRTEVAALPRETLLDQRALPM